MKGAFCSTVIDEIMQMISNHGKEVNDVRDDCRWDTVCVSDGGSGCNVCHADMAHCSSRRAEKYMIVAMLGAWVVAVLWVGEISSPTSPLSNGGDTSNFFHMGGCGGGVCGGVPVGVPHAPFSFWRGTSISRLSIYKRKQVRWLYG